MFSFKETGALKPVAKISFSDKKNKDLIVYLHEHVYGTPFGKGFYEKIDLRKLFPEQKCQFEYVPETRERFVDILSIAGGTGSGKSTLVASCVKELMKAFKMSDDDVFICKKSTVEDPAFKILGQPTYVYINQEFAAQPITLEDIAEKDEKTGVYKPKCLVFDDLDTLDLKIKRVFDTFQRSALQEARKYNIYIYIATHNLARGLDTKSILTESTIVGCLTHSLSSDLKYAFEKYYDFSKAFINELRHSGTRWWFFYKNYPQIILTQNMILLFDAEREADRLKEEQLIKKSHSRGMTSDLIIKFKKEMDEKYS